MFGQITGGLAVADKINAAGASTGTPTTVYKMTSVTISVSPPASTPTTSTPTTSKPTS
jgi:hypothetical protein